MKNKMIEPTKEQTWKEEARKAYQDQQSQDNEGGCREPIGFVQGYLAAKKSDFQLIIELKVERDQFKLEGSERFKEIESLKKELTYYKSKGLVFYDRDKLNEEIKTLKEQLAKAEQRIFHAPHCITNYERNDCDCGYERYFKEKQDKDNKDEK